MNAGTKALLTLIVLLLCAPGQAGAGISVTSGLTYETTAAPGETYKGQVTLHNGSDTAQEVKIYQKDYLFYADGRNIYGEPGGDPRSNAGWISFSPHRVFVPPNGFSVVGYQVAVPDDKALSGTYWSMMMVESVPAATEPLAETKGQIQVGLKQVIRFGAQIRTQVGDTGTRKIAFHKPRLKNEESGSVLEVDVENTGDRYLKSSLSATLYGEDGKPAGEFGGGRVGLYPATSAKYTFALGQLPKGRYKALVVADCGGDDIFGATYTIGIE